MTPASPLPLSARSGHGWRTIGPLVTAVVLLALGLANIRTQATWRHVEDGVLWADRDHEVVARDITGPAAAAGLRTGDVLLAINGQQVHTVADVARVLRGREAGASLRYSVLRLAEPAVVDLRLAIAPGGTLPLYFILAAVGIFTLLVGVAVRLRRPHDAATLHFFWLSVAFFGVFTFSFSGRLDRLDWVFYWADAVARLLLPPLFLHFSLVFPMHRTLWRGRASRAAVPLMYLVALGLGLARALALLRSGDGFMATMEVVDRLHYLYLAACIAIGLVAMARTLREAGTLTARRQSRWIAWGTALGGVPFAVAYAVPYALGVDPSLPMELSVLPLGLVPLAYASAIVRYRLMDVEIIVKRALTSVAALAAIVAIYAVLLQVVERLSLPGDTEHNWIIALLATLVALLLAPPVKEVVQNALDRAFYRDRYDYRRALVGFARDLNSDLDLHRLSSRLVARIAETLLVDRIALLLDDDGSGRFTAIRSVGFQDEPPTLPADSAIAARLRGGHIVTLDDPLAVGRFPAEDIEFWRDAGLLYFVPCDAKRGSVAVLAVGPKDTGEPLNSEDLALLSAVAGQIATALENARLYRQLHDKADELDRMRAFNQNIVESLDDGVLVTDVDDRVVRWNSALVRMYGVLAEEAIGRTLDELFDAPVVDAVRAARRDSPDGASLSHLRLTTRGPEEARTLLVNATVAPLRSTDGLIAEAGGTIAMLTDITSRVQMEEQLQISEKMASIGVLAAGVAHEVNTPLTGISSFTQMLLEGAAPDDPRTRLLEKIERQTFRAAKIVNSLLNLSRPAAAGMTERAPVDVNGIVEDVLSLLEHQLEIGNIKVRRDLAAGPVRVMGAEHTLQQVFLNLFLNARDAMPRGGWLSIATRAEGGRVVAEVSDTGSGIEPENMARIYDPFFTTKATGQGTGLGLSITYGIVREHGGTMACDSTVGQGTRFTVTFSDASATADRSARAQ
ncbi:MAG: ATP-binding protein [Vicinamibacterales bacterium]|nr:ATP-binding protein [Vicinamibacterales bacterium]